MKPILVTKTPPFHVLSMQAKDECKINIAQQRLQAPPSNSWNRLVPLFVLKKAMHHRQVHRREIYHRYKHPNPIF